MKKKLIITSLITEAELGGKDITRQQSKGCHMKLEAKFYNATTAQHVYHSYLWRLVHTFY